MKNRRRKEKLEEALTWLLEEYHYMSRKMTEINNIEFGLSDIKLLISRTKEKSIRVCPFCFAKIDLPAIKRKENNYIEELKELKQQRKLIAGIKGFISDAIKQIEKLLKTIKSKNDFILKFKKEMEGLKGNV
ncbi:hypothetical protein LCGC14_3083740 [marine sediment metagenome]|uniref:Uncharacterized protein n=1 Tax=marine sediment metagenome TaxID=412755 RepID=A0A0F8X154_9ZZZZ